MKRLTTRARLRRAVPLLLAGAVATITACSSSASSSGPASAGNSNAPVLVWTDSTRQPAFEDFQKAHPNVKMKIEVVDPTSLLSKIQLANRVGSGWPDVMFDATPSDVASLASPLFNYALPLNKLIPQSVQDNFATHNAACTIGGTLYCLQNDLAQDVLWYNKPLMAKFGYQVPTTWAQYQALGEEVAKQHPGYVIGAEGDQNVYYDELWSSGCPLATVVSGTEVKINTSAASCTEVASTFDPLLADGSVSRMSPLDPAFEKLAKSGKLLMMSGPSWWAQYVMAPSTGYGIPNGEVAAAPIPTWAGQSTNYSGAWGGGIYLVSAHAKNQAAAVEIAQWVATSPVYQSTAPTYPAYIPAAAVWLNALKTDPFFASDPAAVLTNAASKINPAEGPTRYQVAAAVTTTVVNAIKSGQTIASALPGLQTQLSGLAQTVGYAVTP